MIKSTLIRSPSAVCTHDGRDSSQSSTSLCTVTCISFFDSVDSSAPESAADASSAGECQR